MEKKIKVLMGMDSYLPDMDGVINTMRHYMLNAYEKIDAVAMAPAARGYTEEDPYKIVRCRSLHIPLLNVQYGRPKFKRHTQKEVKNDTTLSF